MKNWGKYIEKLQGRLESDQYVCRFEDGNEELVRGPVVKYLEHSQMSKIAGKLR